MAVEVFRKTAVLTANLICLAEVSATTRESVAGTNAIPWSVEVEADLGSRYVWRGLAFSEGWVAQPAISVSASSITFCWWNNYDLGEKTTASRWNETDLTLMYEADLGRLSLEAGVQSFLYPSGADCPHTAEAAFKLTFDVGPFALWTRHSFDVVAYPGSYFGEAGLELEHALSRRLTFEACTWVGWASARFNDAYIGWSSGAFQQVALELASCWQISTHMTLRPHVGLSALLDGSLRRNVKEPDLFWGGVAAHFHF